MANQPRFNFPDFNYKVGTAHGNEDLAQIETFFGPSRYQKLDPTDNRPIESQTLAQAYAGENQYLTNILHFNFVNGSGWWFTFAPLERTEGLNQLWSMFTWDRVSMEPAPEDTAPHYVTFRREDHVESLSRFKIGAEWRHDFYKRPEGRASAEVSMMQMVSGGWITAKLVVSQAVINSKLYWKEWNLQHGPTYVDVMSALREEIRTFGGLSKDDQGIYKMHHDVMATMKDAEPNINMIVLAKGSMDFLALSGSYEREGQRRGVGTIDSRLSLGGKSMSNLFEGITIYEDDVFALQNLGPDEINTFVRIAIIGRYMMADGSDFGDGKDSYPADKLLSFMHASMDIDAFKLMKISTMINKSMRWNSDGSLSDAVYSLVVHAQSILETAQIKLHHPDYLDPYVWRSQAYNSVDGSTNGYHVIQHWGDMDEHYMSLDQSRLFGEMAAKNAMAELRQLHAQHISNIEDLKALRDRLHNVEDLLSDTVQGYFTAVACNPENRTPGAASFRGHNSFMLNGNRFGSVDLPHVDHRVETDGPNGVMYVKRGPEKLYVFALKGQTRNAGDGIAPLRPAGGLDGAVLAYVVAPLNAFGVLSSGTSPLFQYGDGGVVASLVHAPAVPYGSAITQLRTLASYHSQGNTRGWDKAECEKAFRGITSLNEWMKIERRRLGRCHLFQEKYVPYYMLCHDKELNTVNAVLASLWDEVKDPLWIRIPNVMRVNGSELLGVTQGMEDPNKLTDPLSFSGEDLNNLVVYMGDTDGLALAIPHNQDTVLEALATILNNKRIDPRIRDDLKNNSGPNSAASVLFTNYRNTIGRVYARKDADKHGYDDTFPQFATLFVREILPLFNLYRSSNNRDLVRQMVNIFNAILGLARAASVNPTQSFTEDGLDVIIQKAKAMASLNHGERRTLDDEMEFGRDAARPGDERNNIRYINTRMAISNEGFIRLANQLRANPDNERLIGDVTLMVLRPSDPSGVGRPLASLHVTGNRALDHLLELSRASASMRPGHSHGSIFSRASALLVHHQAYDELVGPQTSYRTAGAPTHDPYSHSGHNHVPRSMVDEATGPLYALDSRTAVDRDGVSTVTHTNIIQKVWLAKRLDHLSTVCTNDFVRVPAQMLALSEVHADVLHTLVKEKLPIPDCCYIFAQPWVRIRMSSGLWAEGGSQTARTGYNYEDVVLQFNGTYKVWSTHYTIWLNTAVLDPTKFTILQDIKFEGYIAGMDDTINDDSTAFDAGQIDWKTVKSGFIFSCGARFGRDLALKVANPLSLWGRYDRKYLPQNFASRQTVFSTAGPLFPSYPFYEMVWGFSKLNNKNVVDGTTFAAVRDSPTCTGLMLMAKHLLYDHKTDLYGTHGHVVDGTGHLDCWNPPMLDVLNGKIPFKADKTYK